MGELLERFPLFPLGIVVLPSELVPLHIFEERYKTMIGECLLDEREFGILWLSDSGLREVGCTVAIAQLLERMEDGRMNILCRGRQAFRLLRRIDDLPYPAGEIELLDDDEGELVVPDAAEARERYAELVERATDERPSAEAVAELSAYEMAATVDFDLDAKQALLELRSEADRLRRLGGLLGTAMKRLDYVELAGERARGNGHLAREARP